jgi:hypothetical protein
MKYVMVLLVMLASFMLTQCYLERGPWYLGCADASGQEYLIKVEQKPYIRDGFIVIGNDTFITPMQGMTCKIITEKSVQDKVKVTPTSNPVI